MGRHFMLFRPCGEARKPEHERKFMTRALQGPTLRCRNARIPTSKCGALQSPCHELSFMLRLARLTARPKKHEMSTHHAVADRALAGQALPHAIGILM